MGTTALQIAFNGHGRTVVATVAKALAHIELDLNRNAALEPFAEAFPMLHAAGIEIGLAHRLAHMAREEGREMIEIVMHDLDTAAGNDTAISTYDFIDPQDPDTLVSVALLRAEREEVDLADFEKNLHFDVRRAVERRLLWASPEKVLTEFSAVSRDFSPGTTGVQAIDYASFESSLDRLPAVIADAAVTAFDLAATRAFTDENRPRA